MSMHPSSVLVTAAPTAPIVCGSAGRPILALDLGTSSGWALRGHGGLITSGTVSLRPEEVKREGWREQRVLAVSLDDDRPAWPEGELNRQPGEKLHGDRDKAKEVRR